MKLAFPPPPDKYDPRYLADVLRQIQDAFNDLMTSETLAIAPEKPKQGMIAVADGTNWDPGSGTGCYVYVAGWRRMD